MVYLTAKLKNDHVRFKVANYEKVGTYQQWKVACEESCEMGKWISECESKKLSFVNTQTWEELKNVHTNVQKYVDMNAQRATNEELRDIAAIVESSTISVFDRLNDIKQINCEHHSS